MPIAMPIAMPAPRLCIGIPSATPIASPIPMPPPRSAHAGIRPALRSLLLRSGMASTIRIRGERGIRRSTEIWLKTPATCEPRGRGSIAS